MSLTYDINAEKWFSHWKLNPMANPDYYEMLFRYFKSMVAGMDKRHLITKLDEMIKEKIEIPMGANYQAVLHVYKNLPALNSFTKSRNPEYPEEYVYKYTIKEWLDEIQTYIFDILVELEPEINFKDNQKLL